MPTWGEILGELQPTPDFDGVRRKYLGRLSGVTGRPVIAYMTAWAHKNADAVIITDSDMTGFMEVTHGLNNKGDDERPLDLLISSPGGSPNATESIVSYLRQRFTHIRAIVPHCAMSAACMLCCAADEIVMAKHSSLGPIDPQIPIHTPTGFRYAPAESILSQFEMAKAECAKDPAQVAVWYPILMQYGPDLLQTCQNAVDLSKELVERWLSEYMCKDDTGVKARAIAGFLADHNLHKDHGRHLSRQVLINQGLRISSLEDDEDLQDAVLSVFHAFTHTFQGTPVAKIVENHLGKAYIQV